jgi:serine/threonine protein kinase
VQRDVLLALDFEIPNDLAKSITDLNHNTFLLLQMMVNNLKQVFTLNQEILSAALQKITNKVPKVPESTIELIDRTNTHNQYQIGQAFTFFTLRSTGRIPDFPNCLTPGYLSTDSKTPELMIKKIVTTDAKTMDYLPTEARHEAKNCRLLGRLSFLMNLNTSNPAIRFPAVVMPYQSGITMQQFEKLSETEKLAIPSKDRLKCYTNLLCELNQIHQQHRAHRDLHFGNMILNVNELKLTLVDFGLTQKVRDITKIPQDVHRAGWLLMGIFREISPLLPPDTPLPKHCMNTIQMKAVKDLFEAMNSKKSKDCCTSEQALQYCEKLWEQYDQLDEEKLALIQSQTINRNEATIEDVLRGSLRSLLFPTYALRAPARQAQMGMTK